MQADCFRTIRKIAVAIEAVACSDSRISHHGNVSRASSEWCRCAHILEPTLQVSLRLIHWLFFRAFKSIHCYFQKDHLIMLLVKAMSRSPLTDLTRK